MKKYIVPTITVEKIGGEGLPTAGISSEKGSTADDVQPGHDADGYSKSFNIWE